MRARRSTMTLLATMALLAGCATADPVAADRIEPGAAALATRDTDAPAVPLPAAKRDSLRPLPSDGYRTVDDRSAALARSTPGGYAGVYLEGGTHVVLLTDTTDVEATLRALLPRLNAQYGGPTLSREAVRVRRVRWDFVHLDEWYRYLTNVTWRDDVYASDIDERRNRLAYTVRDVAAKARLEARVAAAGAPCGLVLAEVGRPVRPY